MRERVVYVGQSVAMLEWLCARPDVEMVASFCPPQAQQASAMLTCALHYGTPLLWARDSAEVEAHLPPGLDVGVCAFFERLSPAVLRAPRLGWLNLHPAPLPEWPGRLPTVEGVLAGAREWGASLHWMSEALDQGPLVEVRRAPRSWADGPAELEERAVRLGLAMLSDHWRGLMEGYAPYEPQAPQPPHRAPRYRVGLDLTRSPLELWRQVKAYAPFGGAPMRVGDRVACVTRAELVVGSSVAVEASLPTLALSGRLSAPFTGPLTTLKALAWAEGAEGADLKKGLVSFKNHDLTRLTPQEEALFLFEPS